MVAIRLHKEGYTQEKISSVFECSLKSVYNWIRDHKRYGKSGLNESTRGRKYGEKRSLTKDQEKDIQKHIKRAYEQQPAQLKKWLTEQYPAIEAKAKQENVKIHWCDETGLSSEDNRGRGYSPKGKTPVAYKTGKRFSTSMISAINNMGKIRFMI